MQKTSKTLQLFIVALNFIFETYVNLRQKAKLSAKITPAASKVCSEEHYTRACQYNKDKIQFSLFNETFSAIQNALLILYIADYFNFFFKKITKRDELVILSVTLVTQVINLPLRLYYDFVVEARYGFNKKTIGLFLKDTVLGLTLAVGFSTPILFIIKSIIRSFPNFPLYVTVFLSLFRVFMIVIYPNFITPLYNKVTPLQNEVLKKRVEEMAAKVNFTIDKIEVIDGSKRTGHSNAYFIGLGKAKRIVFYDTILEQMTDDEVLAVLCHELGHWYHSHILINSIISSIITFSYAVAFKMYIKDSKNFKFDENTIYFSNLVSFMAVPMTLVMNTISRVFERQADRFAVKHGYGAHLISGLLKLHSENMGAPVVDSLYSALAYSHPHITERIEAIEKEMKKNL